MLRLIHLQMSQLILLHSMARSIHEGNGCLFSAVYRQLRFMLAVGTPHLNPLPFAKGERRTRQRQEGLLRTASSRLWVPKKITDAIGGIASIGIEYGKRALRRTDF